LQQGHNIFALALIFVQALGKFGNGRRHRGGVWNAARLHLLGLLAGAEQ
jgi:hypothetical protein